MGRLHGDLPAPGGPDGTSPVAYNDALPAARVNVLILRHARFVLCENSAPDARMRW